jgi:hypothetical protein
MERSPSGGVTVPWCTRCGNPRVMHILVYVQVKCECVEILIVPNEADIARGTGHVQETQLCAVQFRETIRCTRCRGMDIYIYNTTAANFSPGTADEIAPKSMRAACTCTQPIRGVVYDVITRARSNSSSRHTLSRAAMYPGVNSVV